MACTDYTKPESDLGLKGYAYFFIIRFRILLRLTAVMPR